MVVRHSWQYKLTKEVSSYLVSVFSNKVVCGPLGDYKEHIEGL